MTWSQILVGLMPPPGLSIYFSLIYLKFPHILSHLFPSNSLTIKQEQLMIIGYNVNQHFVVVYLILQYVIVLNFNTKFNGHQDDIMLQHILMVIYGYQEVEHVNQQIYLMKILLVVLLEIVLRYVFCLIFNSFIFFDLFLFHSCFLIFLVGYLS